MNTNTSGQSSTTGRNSDRNARPTLLQRLRNPLSPKSNADRRRHDRRKELKAALDAYTKEIRKAHVTSNWRPHPFPDALSVVEDGARRLDPALFGWPVDNGQITGPRASIRCFRQIELMSNIIKGNFLDFAAEDPAAQLLGVSSDGRIEREDLQPVLFGPAPRHVSFEERVELAISSLRERIDPTEGRTLCRVC